MAKRTAPPNRIAQAGNYVAPIDPTGLDPEMARTLGLTDKPKVAKKKTRFVDAVKKTFGIK